MEESVLQEVQDIITRETEVEEDKDLIEFDGRKIHKRFSPLIDIIRKSDEDTASVLKREMYLHQVEECSCYFCNTYCIAGAFLEGNDSVYDMNKKVERIKNSPEILNHYKMFTVPEYDVDENETEFFLHQTKGILDVHLGIVCDIEKNMKFLDDMVGRENVDVNEIYRKLCDMYDSVTPYAIACALGLEEAEQYR